MLDKFKAKAKPKTFNLLATQYFLSIFSVKIRIFPICLMSPVFRCVSCWESLTGPGFSTDCRKRKRSPAHSSTPRAGRYRSGCGLYLCFLKLWKNVWKIRLRMWPNCNDIEKKKNDI